MNFRALVVLAVIALAGCAQMAPDETTAPASPTDAPTSITAAPTQSAKSPSTTSEPSATQEPEPPASSSWGPAPIPSRTYDDITTGIHAYLIEQGTGAPGNIGCGDQAVPGIIVELKGQDPIVRAFAELLSLADIADLGESGLYNALYQSNLTYERHRVWLDPSIVEVWLTGELVTGGTCDSPRIIAQLEKTAASGARTQAAIIYINGVDIDTVLDERG